MELKDLPTEFTLGALKWKISLDTNELQKDNCYGKMMFTAKLITLSNHHHGFDIDVDSIEQTLYHEVTHAILDTLGEHELSNNEEFVQKFSLLLHQFEKTKK